MRILNNHYVQNVPANRRLPLKHFILLLFMGLRVCMCAPHVAMATVLCFMNLPFVLFSFKRSPMKSFSSFSLCCVVSLIGVL